MNWLAFIYLIPYFLSVIISVGVGIYAWRHRHVAGAIPLTWLALSEAAWTGGYILELTSSGLEAKIFWDNIQFVGVFIPPLAFLAFALQYTGRQLAHPKRTFGLLAAPFFLAALLIVTDKLHGLIRPAAWLVPGEPFAELTYDFTPTFWIIALYSYGLILSSLFILITKFIRPHLLYRLQVAILILGILIPLLGTLLTMAGLTFTVHRDTTPLTFAVGNLILAWGLFRYRLLDLAPVARDMLTENMSDAMFVLDHHSRVVDLNPVAHALVGQPGITLIGQPASQVFSNWPDLVEAFSSEAQTRVKLAQGEGESRRYFDSIVSPLRNRHSRSLGHLLVMRDVTELTRVNNQLQEEIAERLQIEQTLRESEAFNRVVLNSLAAHVVVLDSEGTITAVNEAWLRFAGENGGDEILLKTSLGANYLDVCRRATGEDADQAGEALAGIQAVLAGSQSHFTLEYRCHSPDQNRWFLMQVAPLVTKQGGVVVSHLNITERKQAEEALRESEARLRTITENAPNFMVELDPQGMMLFVNRPAPGYHLSDFFGASAYDWIPPEYHPVLQQALEQTFSTGQPAEYETQGAGDHGELRWYDSRIGPVIIGGQVRSAILISSDITRRKQAEEALRQAHVDLETRIIQRTAELRQANEALRQSEARNLARYHEAEVLRQAALALTSTTDLSLLLHRILTELQKVVPYDSASIQLLKEDNLEIIAAHGFDNPLAVVGVRFPAHGEASPNAHVIASREPLILNDVWLGPFRLKQELYGVPAIRSWLGVPLFINERSIGMITLDKHETNFYTHAHAQTALAYAAQAAIVLENVRLYQDLHTQMQVLQATQAQLVQSERMAALGRLMASIAHEINNPLQAVQGVLGLLGEELEGSHRQEKIEQYLYIANSEIERIAGIVHRMRDFYRPTRLRQAQTGDFYGRLSSAGEITAELPSILESVFMLANKQLQHSRVKIEQLLDPILPPLPVNPDHLKQVFLNLTLNALDAMAEQGGTLRVCARPDKVRLAGRRPQRVVRIEFSDTGAGMPAEVLARLFEPLFSTKEHGSGFGLFTSYQIIQAYEGRISADSEEGRGTTFTILLPVKARLRNQLTQGGKP